jgi:Fe2+ or Zn2+ uptake regulation protein
LSSLTYEKMALARLKEQGFRITMPRVLVVRALAGSDKALDAYALHNVIEDGGGRIDVVSVYRILETLRESGLVYKVGAKSGYFRREASSGILAFNGERILEAKPNPNIAQLVNAIAADLGVSAESFQLEITGAK